MKLLFDFKTPQKFIGGGAEYIRKVFYSLYSKIQHENLNIEILGLVDSSIKKFAYKDLSPDSLSKKGIDVVDIAHNSLKNIIERNNVDLIFIGVGQSWIQYDIENINCPVICVLHDIWNEEFKINFLDYYLLLDEFYKLCKHKIKDVFWDNQREIRMNKLITMLNENPKAKIVTVSDFSKKSLMYNFQITEEKIIVFFAPERLSVCSETIENEQLKSLIGSGRKYYLMVSSDRRNKNAEKTINAFKYYVSAVDKNSYLVTVGYKQGIRFDNHIILPYLSESDLANAMANCYALIFPSLIEGFGYPPIEAMSHGKPVLCSNVTSIPEVVADAAVSFSPFYETDIFNALCKLNTKTYKYYCDLSLKQYKVVSQKQKADLESLIELIVNYRENPN